MFIGRSSKFVTPFEKEKPQKTLRRVAYMDRVFSNPDRVYKVWQRKSAF